MSRIGIFSIREKFSIDLMKKINSIKKDETRVEIAVVGETKLCEKSLYRLIIDRVSSYVSYFSAYFKNASLMGTYVINNPFGVNCIDRFYNYYKAKTLGFSVPRTVCLPSREYHPDCGTEDLANLKYPLDWEAIGDFIGFPAILKLYDGYGFRDTFEVNNVNELIQCYNGTGRQVMIMQEFINFDYFVKTFVIGGNKTFSLKFNPSTREYTGDKKALAGLPINKIVESSMQMGRNLNLDFHSVEFAVKDDVFYAVNFLNPYPDCREESLTEECYSWCLDNLAQLALEYATSGKTNKTDVGSI